jgi:uncharacterized protein YqfA (UPF0365 family)
MNKPLALLFSVVAIILFICVGISLSYRLPLLALLFAIAAFIHIGIGFVVKARLRKKQ